MDNPFENSSDDTSPPNASLAVPPLRNISEQIEGEKSSIITARGTAEGLVLRMDGRVEPGDLRSALLAFLEARRSFVSGHDVSIEWVGSKPEENFVQEISTLLTSSFQITLRGSKLKTQVVKSIEDPGVRGEKTPAPSTAQITAASKSASAFSTSSHVSAPKSSSKTVSLFDGIENLEDRASSSSAQGFLWDEPDARVIYTTLRSGQKIETEHSVVVFGDINSGAEVIAGGDIVILGILRGVAHAGAYDETGGGRVIFAINLQPTQLRIGTVISRGTAGERVEGTRVPEVARVSEGIIVVEPYQSRNVWGRRRE